MTDYQKKLGYAVRKRSASPNTYYTQAREHIRNGDAESALRVLAEIDPSLRGHEWDFLQGSALWLKGDCVDGVSHLQRAYAAKPDNREYWKARKATHPDKEWIRAEKKRQQDEIAMECCCECCGTGACECICDGLCNGW